MFWNVVAERASAEGDDFAGFVGDGENNPAAKTVEEAACLRRRAALIAREKAGRFEKLFGVFRLEMAQKRVAGGRGVAQAETRDGFIVEAANLEIGARDFAFGG